MSCRSPSQPKPKSLLFGRSTLTPNFLKPVVKKFKSMTYNSKGVQYMKIYQLVHIALYPKSNSKVQKSVEFFPFVHSVQLGCFHLNMEPMCTTAGQLELLSKLLFFNLIHFCTMYSTFCFIKFILQSNYLTMLHSFIIFHDFVWTWYEGQKAIVPKSGDYLGYSCAVWFGGQIGPRCWFCSVPILHCSHELSQ